MAYTFRGIGALHYGQRDFRADGSYVTTLWFVLFYLPVLPIKSIRLRRTGEAKYYGLKRVPVYDRLDQRGIHWAQVFSVYAWFAAELAILIEAKLLRSPWLIVPALLLLGLPWLLRRRALERVNTEVARRAAGFSAELPEKPSVEIL